MLDSLKKKDKAVHELILKEINRQKHGLCMIPSENHASVAVLESPQIWLHCAKWRVRDQVADSPQFAHVARDAALGTPKRRPKRDVCQAGSLGD